MESPPRPPTRSAFLLGLLTVMPLAAWWLAWYPGFLSSDSMDQYRQAVSFDFFNYHPITHTASMWLATRLWESPGAVALAQVLLMAVVLALVARRLVALGVPLWPAVATVWIVSLLPMVGITTIAIWKDVAFTIALLWAFSELLLLAADRSAFWKSTWGPVRLGIALGLVWALRSNGFITAIVMLAALAVAERRRIARVGISAAAVLATGVVLPLMLVTVLPVEPGGIEPAEVFLPDIASVIVHAPDTLDAGDVALITALASETVWRQQYECTDSTPLVFDPRLDTEPIGDDPWAYRRLIVENLVQAAPTVAGHRWCAADYLFVPVARTGSFLHYPPFDIPENDLGVAREPLSSFLFDVTFPVYQWVERHTWLTWRPALAVLIGLATWIGVALRRRLRPTLWAGALFVVHLGNVVVTTPAQEFRYAFPLYLMGLLSLPMWWLIASPDRLHVDLAEEEPALETDRLRPQ